MKAKLKKIINFLHFTTTIPHSPTSHLHHRRMIPGSRFYLQHFFNEIIGEFGIAVLNIDQDVDDIFMNGVEVDVIGECQEFFDIFGRRFF